MLVVDKENYEKEVVEETSVPVIVDVWGPKCTNCLALMPTMETLEEKYKDKVKFTKLNAAENRRLCMKLRLMSLPSFMLYKNGEEVDRFSGEMTEQELTEKVENFVEQYS